MSCVTVLEKDYQLKTLYVRKTEAHNVQIETDGMNDKQTEMTDNETGHHPKTTSINSGPKTDAARKKKNKNEYPGQVVHSRCDSNTEMMTTAVSKLAIDKHTDDKDLEVDAVPLDAEPVDVVSVMPSTESSASLSSMTSQGSSLSLDSNSTSKSLCSNHLTKKKSDFVILNAEADNEEACRYKAHLESLRESLKSLAPDIIIPEGITGDVFSLVGAGQSEFTALNDLTNSYNRTLVLVTENCIKCQKTKFKNEMLMNHILTNNLGSAVVPVWTKNSRTFTETVPMELAVMKGLQYYTFENELKELGQLGQLGRYYVESVRKLINEGRGINN